MRYEPAAEEIGGHQCIIQTQESDGGQAHFGVFVFSHDTSLRGRTGNFDNAELASNAARKLALDAIQSDDGSRWERVLTGFHRDGAYSIDITEADGKFYARLSVGRSIRVLEGGYADRETTLQYARRFAESER